MDPQPDDLTATDDLTLLQAARSGDRLAFGVLYLRHHAAAWRIACVASRFSPDAELAVIEGFTRVFSALPAESEEFEGGGVTFRPYLLACVRQAALDRARAAGRAEPGSTRHGARSGLTEKPAAASRLRAGNGPASPAPPAPLAGLAPNGEVVLSSLEHHVARGALAGLPERSRTALWLSDVEAMTPGEVGGILGSSPEVVTGLTGAARSKVRAAQEVAHGRHETRADCRFTVDHLGAYHTATLDPKKGVLVRSHLDLCPPCRMRLGELANAPATLAAAVPAAPLLGGEAQHHWLTSAGEACPAERLLPPGLAAASLFRRFPDVLHRGPDRRTHRLAVAAGRLPAVARRAGRTAWPALPAVSLVLVWLAVMLAVPRLMQPETAPGPDGLALPAVQAYVPSYLPGAAKRGSGPATRSNPAHNAGGGRDLAAQLTAEVERAGAGGLGSDEGEPAVHLIGTSPASRATGSGRIGVRPAQPIAPAAPVEAVPAVVTTSVPVVPLLVAAPPSPAPVPAPAVDAAAKPKKDSKASKEAKPGQDAKQDRKSERDQERKRSKGSERKKLPVSQDKIVTA
ncbi:MAG TPA: sigma-70 family RNA polymerase sigma factor [Acidimicrobiia bacterium]|nr:sigma-70 family RNA polymerase sigma factor [Acidimicrobiia bacterium]